MLLQLVCAIELVLIVSLLAMAACARGLGVTVRSMTFGVGPVVFDLGALRMALFPLGGHVRLAMLDDLHDGEAPQRAFDQQPTWARVLLPLTGPASMLCLGYAILDAAAFDAFRSTAGQVLAGWSPLAQGQTILQHATDTLSQLGMLAIIGLVACKCAALNLIPLAGTSGAQALLALLPARAALTQRVSYWHTLLTLPLSLLVLGAWCVALAFFIGGR